MTIDKRIDYEIQGGVKNYRPSEMVTVPKIAKSSPDTPTAKLAYITPEEEKILVDLNLYGSLKGKPNKGPGGLPSLEGDFGPGGESPGSFRSGADIQSAETGNFQGFDGSPPVELPPGVQPKPSDEAQALRNAAIVAGAGQRVNPGFFDSRNVISPIELARAKASNPRLFNKIRGGGLGGFLSSGGIFGNLIRGIGQRLGFGKKFNEPTYDMRRFSNLGLFEPSLNPNFQNDLGNEGLLSLTKNIPTTDDSEIEKQYGEYLMDAPPNPLTLEQFKNAVKNISTPPVDLSLQDLDEIGEFADFVSYDKLRNMGLSEGPGDGTNPKLGDLTSFIEPLATKTARERILKDLFSSNTGSGVPNAADLIVPITDTGSALTTPVEGLYGLSLVDTRTLQRGGYTNSQIKEAVDGGYAEELANSMRGQLGV